ncbi:MAG: LacI family DNA-binding transcriptional regulator [Cellulosilyticaceae bacterium]
MPITIKEIAKLAQVSVTSVSLVLNNKPCRISKDTQEKIRTIANAHNYKANAMAKGLATKKSNSLGLVIPNIVNTYFSNITNSISAYAQEAGYSLLLTHSNDSHHQDLKLIEELLDRGVEGLFLILSDASFKGSRFEKIYTLLQASKVPYVLIDRIPSGYQCNQVYVDNEQGGYLAGKYLTEQDHTRIGFIENPHSLNGQKRIVGFKKALAEAGIEVDASLMASGDFSVESGYLAGDTFSPTSVTALFSSNDLMAYGLIQNFKNRGIKPMGDIEIIGYDNLFFTQLFDFPFPSIDQHVSDIGHHAFTLLLDQLKEVGLPPQSICLSPQLALNQKNV